MGDGLVVVAVGDIEQLGVASAGRSGQIGDAVGEFIKQLGDHAISVRRRPQTFGMYLARPSISHSKTYSELQ